MSIPWAKCPHTAGSPRLEVDKEMEAGKVKPCPQGSEICLIVSNFLDSMDCSPPGSSVHRILLARILEWVVIPFSRGSSQLRDRTWVSCIADRFFTI